MASMNVISAFLTQMLSYVDSIIGNYGVSVVVFTLLVKIVLLPLDIKSKKSMKRMEMLKPQLDALQKKYGQDKEKYNQKMSELYKKEKVNPMAGCLPMLLQLPILFCMFTAMRVVANEQTVEMLLGMMNGEAPVLQPFLWIKNVFQPDSFMSTIIPAFQDQLASITGVVGSEWLTQENVEAVKAFLSSPEYHVWTSQYGADTLRYSAPLLMWTISIPTQFNGLFILPVLSAVSQFVTTKLTPTQATGDANASQSNQIMKYFFPLFSLWICATSTSAFAIYWVASNLIQTLQQLLLTYWFNAKERKKNELKEVSEP